MQGPYVARLRARAGRRSRGEDRARGLDRILPQQLVIVMDAAPIADFDPSSREAFLVQGCPSCGAKVPSGARYCADCGAPLGSRCGMCGAAVPAAARFCPSCGSRLSRPARRGALARRLISGVASRAAVEGRPGGAPGEVVATDEQVGDVAARPESQDSGSGSAALSGGPLGRDERRLVTVLFADITGFTSLAERHDPESVKSAVDRLLRSLAGVVEKYGGTVDKFIGDNIMAVFGAPFAHEDDTERALRAALEMRERVEAFNKEQGDGGFQFDVRIGVNAGEVVAGRLGGEGAAEYTVIGDAVNVAARLQQAAEPGEILVGAEAKQLCPPLLRFSKPRKISAKGKSQPVVAYSLEAALGPPGGAGREVEKARGIESPFLGREEELQALRVLARVAADLRRPYLITVVGEPGIGKTRLVEEAITALENEGFVALWGRALPYGSTSRLYPLVEMAKALCGVEEGDSPEAAREKVVKTTSVIFGSSPAPSSGLQRRILEAMGMQEAEAAEVARDVAAPILALFEAASQRFPLILAFDDLHWAEDELLDVVDRVSMDAGAGALVVFAIARPELLERRPTWGGGKRQSHITEIGSLPEEVSARLARQLFAPEEPSSDLVDVVVRRAGGNPLFISELVAYLKGHGLRRGREGRLELDESAPDALPLTLRSVIGARLDSLSSELRELVQVASVVGDEFSAEALSVVSGLEEDEVGGALEELEREGLVVEDLTSGEGRARTYRFKHGLVRETAYRLLPRASRSRLHAAYGEWLESVWVPSVAADLTAEGAGVSEVVAYDPSAERIAYHYEEAAKLAAPGEEERARRRAFDFLVKSAHRASGMALYREAERLYVRAHSLLPPTASSLEGLAWAKFCMGDLDSAEEVVAQAVELADSVGDSSAEARCLLTLAHILQRRGELEEAVELTERAARVWESSGESGGVLKAEIARAELLVLGGAPRKGIEYALDAASKAREMGSEYLESTALQLAGVGHYLVGEPVEARKHLEDSLMLASSAGSIPAVGGAIVALGLLDYWEGRLEDVAATGENLMKLAHEAGELRGEAFASGLAGAAYVALGRTGKATRLLEENLRLSERIQDRLSQALAAVYLGHAKAYAGHVKAAEEMLLEAFVLARSSGNNALAGGALVVLAEILIETGRLGEAALRLREARLSFEDFQAPGSPWRLEMLRAAANLAERCGDTEGAQALRRAALQQSEGGYEERAIVVRPLMLEMARALTREGSLEEAEAYVEESAELATEDAASEVLEPVVRGELSAARKRFEEAEGFLQSALGKASRRQNVFLVKLAGEALREFYVARGQEESAAEVMEATHSLIERIESLPMEDQ